MKSTEKQFLIIVLAIALGSFCGMADMAFSVHANKWFKIVFVLLNVSACVALSFGVLKLLSKKSDV